ncbi:hypothetical protein [Modestobacter sp. Leaf380]|uniref:hypothetical protein n=1 Tax=Modestobacter sp. Leaf380 TaxID=1736356 RepID=UPI0012F83638|nr:hypothetical protein [Modestobacter sp. Leaf380]
MLTRTSRTTPGARVAGRLSIGLVDAGVSSIGNLGVSIVAARALPFAEFSVFATVVLVLLLATTASRSVHGDVLVLRSRGGAADQDPAVDPRRSTRSVLAVSGSVALLVLTGTLTARLAGLLPASVVPVLVVAALALPLLCLQDHLRWIEYARGQSQFALANNATWTVTALVGLAVTTAVLELDAAAATAVWALATLPGTAVALRRRGRDGLGMRHGRSRWHRDVRGLSRPLFLDFLLTQATAQGALLLVAVLAGADEIGHIRKAQIWLGVATVVTTGLLSALQPVLVARHADRGHRSTVRLASVVAVGASLCFVVYGVVLQLLPVRWAEVVVGEGWETAREYVAPLTLLAVGGVAGGCLGIALRATGLVARQVAWRAVLAPGMLVATGVATVLSGPHAGTWALAGGSVVTALVWVGVLARPPRAQQVDR